MVKDLFRAFCIVVALALAAEVTLRIVQPKDQMNTDLDLQKIEAIKKQPPFYRDHFCDSIHQTLRGEQLTARLVTDALAEQFAKIIKLQSEVWTAGASTTRGFNCGSQTSWPLEAEKLSPDLKIKNLALDGAMAEESLAKITDSITKGEKATLIIWSHGLTELGFYGDSRDKNWDALRANQPHVDSINQGRASENLVIFVLRLDLSLQKYSYAYRYFRALLSGLAPSEPSGYSKFVAATTMTRLNQREEFIYHDGPFGGPVRNLLSDSAQDYAIQGYELTLRKAISVARESKIEFVCLILPTVPNFYDFLSSNFGQQFDAWVSKVNLRGEKICQELQATVVDLRGQYLAKASEQAP